ncbi:hypothetical protein C481_18100 [Natrialba asiatica DSM 12278]|uniref:Uncharacterized protein n=1 Tax=Natrialba asiatica (strain ATCC 700177 / DSM 12278 / JCM 9576 / FERM P-10747 / NBRC 102637 / 172P1) TaxID=29540 RepID=M0AH36_NATA1|nr:hypothetical protein C481_18100 [Natrialba asiatica DSM 12278]
MVPFTAGCSEAWFDDPETPAETSTTVTPESYDCSDLSRPEPRPEATSSASTFEDGSAEQSLEPLEYPSTLPDAETTTGAATQYAIEFEQAYRQNALLVEYGEATRAFDLSVTDRQSSPIGADGETNGNVTDASSEETGETNGTESATGSNGTLVSLVYNLTTETTDDNHTKWAVRAVYYVGEVVLRAVYGGVATDPTFDPDPREQTHGELVACLR